MGLGVREGPGPPSIRQPTSDGPAGAPSSPQQQVCRREFWTAADAETRTTADVHAEVAETSAVTVNGRVPNYVVFEHPAGKY